MTSSLHSKKNIAILALPGLLLMAFFVIYPLGRILIMSFQKNDGLSVHTFIGWKNYQTLLSDKEFIHANSRSIWLCLLAVLFNACLAIFTALVLSGLHKQSQQWLRTSFILPMVLSVSVISQLWLAIYHADWGLLNSFLRAIGLPNKAKGWLIDENSAMFCVAIVGMWWFFGMDLLMAFSGINAVPDYLFEAAELDGCSYFQTALHVILPMCKNVCRTCFLVSATGGLFTFPQVYIMTGGGPGDITTTIMMYMYKQAFSNQRLGRAAAVAILGIIELAIIIVIIFGFFHSMKSDEGN